MQAKPVYLKDYERQRLLERGELADVSDSEEEEEEEAGVKTKKGLKQISTYDDEQKELKTR